MSSEKSGRLFVLATLLVAAGLIGHQGETQAQQGINMAPALQAAATMFIPLPSSSLFTPDLVQHIQQLATKDRWRLPEKETSWRFVAEDPYVITRKLDEMWHTVGPRDSRHTLLAKYRGRLSRLQELNPEVDFNNLEEGMNILVWQRDENVSQSWGHANRGRLINGEPLPEGESYRLQYPHRAFGTYYSVSEIVRVLDAYGERFPDSHPLLVGDMSFRDGRKIAPHKSHQSGRDVDITLPRVTAPPDYRRFHNLRRRELDVEKTFWLLKQFVDGGQVEYLFIDRRWQRVLRQHAASQGAPEEWLDAVFEFGSKRPGLAMVRHERGHHRHVHVRFKCQPTDRRCS